MDLHEDGLLTATEAAHYLKISRRTFDRLGLERHYVGRLPRYRMATIEAYLAQHTVHPAPPSQPTPALVNTKLSARHGENKDESMRDFFKRQLAAAFPN